MSADFRPIFEKFAPQPGSSARFSAVTSPAPATAPPAATHCGELKVDLKRDGERITEIRIQCRCGELIELTCEY